MTANMRKNSRNACAANRTPLVISSSGTNGGNWSHLDFLALSDEDDAEDDVGAETPSDLSSTKMLVLYRPDMRRINTTPI